VKRYAEVAADIGEAVAQYASDVRAGSFPEDRHTYGISAEELTQFEASIKAS
jgi:3-methyl-2-oxobutanoate hydroxymethyltransferase